ncbi:helix-turn-helix domain-containing protein [Cryobacterium sp. Y11]|uniref:helix-turn-helix domain-containing protein n=1 Tax=Cryobacterium sp. Y11 TaxID=2045016 RepID=UPI001E5A6943|nr:helix-turn-helix domain-containing protein [Cryobacterium sp. Y11]
MIKLDDWAEIRHLHSTGQHSKREIARLVGVSRGTVDRALAVDRAPTYQREPSGSSFDEFAGRDSGRTGGVVGVTVVVSGESR